MAQALVVATQTFGEVCTANKGLFDPGFNSSQNKLGLKVTAELVSKRKLGDTTVNPCHANKRFDFD